MSKSQHCGSCLFLDREKKFEKPCIVLGKIPTSKACTSFRPDLYQLAHPEEQFTDLDNLVSAIGKMSITQLAILSGLAARERITRKYGYRFFQKVYVRYVGNSANNYLSNFTAARILDVDSKHIRLIGEKDFRAYILLEHGGKGKNESVFTAAEFAPMRRQMIDANKLVDKSVKVEKMLKSSSRGVVAPVDEFLAGSVESTKIKKRKASDDLVSLVSKMSSGMYGTRRREGSSGGDIEVNWI